MRKCRGSERRKFFLAFSVFIEPGHEFKSGQLTNRPLLKNEQNPAILIGFCLFLGLCCGFESLKLRKVAKP